MDLFEQTDEPAKLGFRLQRLEIYNWGTFDQKVWSLELKGDTSLLTGDVGSGKSTLVDAIITLLVPPKKVTYNKAADASAKERSLASYVRGYFAQKRTEDGGGKPEALRDRNQYSVILGVFGDENLGVRVTLAQVFWFRDESTRYPARFYVLAEKTLSIRERFSNIGTDMRSFKKRLESDDYIHTYDDYPPYARDFRRKFGIRQEQAMDLFQQTISMKKVDELTGFVRQNMLEKPETEQDVANLLAHFRDLDEAHTAVVRAKKQQELLVPLVADGDRYYELLERQHHFSGMQKFLSAWFAEKDFHFLERDLQGQQSNLSEDKEKQKKIEEQLQNMEQEARAVQSAMDQNGGSRLIVLKNQLDMQRMQLGTCRGNLERYKKQADLLEIGLPENEAAFQKNGEAVKKQLELDLELENELAEDAGDAESNRKENDKAMQRTAAELESLRKRKSSIPREYIELREQLCLDLNLAEGEMPFAGELMEVREEEGAWEGALERLLRGFGISLLVPQAHYGEVTDWMEHHQLKLRLVYYRVQDYTEPVDLAELDEDAACCKLNLKEDSPFYNWLANELAQRFRHICCETMKGFRQEKFALTKSGQIKLNGRRHEKDDRYRIDDRRQYVLGFSNLKKIQALEAELFDLKEEGKLWQKKLQQIHQQQKKCQARLAAARALQETVHFAELDVQSLQQEIGRLEKNLVELERENEVLLRLKEKAAELEKKQTQMKQQLYDVQQRITLTQKEIRDAESRMKQDQEIFSTYPEDERKLSYARLEENCQDALQGAALERRRFVQQEAVFRHWLDGKNEENHSKLDEQGQKLTLQMSGYMTAYPEQSNVLTASPEALEEYRRILQRLELDALPRFAETFRELLRENTINQIALFQGKLNTACDVIRERIEMINGSLSDIDYNEGRYIQIECTNAADVEIKDFRMQLRACTDNALTASEEDAYSEAKFKEVQRIVERFRGRPDHTEADEKWTKRVTDVRNWFVFAASERWRETDEEYEHYTDSGGKSGGQKEKLAYTILAASLVYNFGLEAKRPSEQSFRFVVIDEAFLKSSDDSARFGLELFKKLDLQLLVVTPLLKIATIEPFVTHVGFVYQRDEEHRSFLRNLTIEELSDERDACAAGQEDLGKKGTTE